MSTPFSLPSFAKINLGLQILGKRADGYHEIRTVLQTVSLHDTLWFEAHEGQDLWFACDDPLVPADENNLVLRAAQALRATCRVEVGAKIKLEKRIPAQAGLGGGSSNAAVALLGLAQLWKITNTSEFQKIAAGLGADVPFFLCGGRALATGIGTEIRSLADIDYQNLLIVTPATNISTAEAYKALKSPALTSNYSDPILAVSRAGLDLADSDQRLLRDNLVNDFERVIFDIEPEIKRAKDALLAAGARGASLSGSGSSLFGIFDSREARQRAIEQIRTESGWHVFPCTTVTREEYSRAMGSWASQLLGSLDLRSDTGA